MEMERPDLTLPFMTDSPYGYRVNVLNPYVQGLFNRFRKKHGIPLHYPPSDEARLTFELQVIPHLEKRFRCKAPPVSIPRRIAERIPIELLKALYGYTGVTALDIKPKAQAEAESGGKESAKK